jgi:hypothetical protein
VHPNQEMSQNPRRAWEERGVEEILGNSNPVQKRPRLGDCSPS